MIIDSHIHLNDPIYENILDEVINDAIKNSVIKMFVVGYDKESSIKAIEIANKYPFIYAIIGLHPSEVEKETDTNLSWLLELLKHPKVIAIGEIGIDLHYDKDKQDLQINYFKKQIEIANKFNKPISIHSRDACELTYQILKENPSKGVIHCYSYSLEMAKKFIDLNYLLGIGGVLTFTNTKLKEIVKSIDLKYLITETDAPYLTPVPFRGKLNRPEYIKYVVQEIANLKHISTDEVELQIEKNIMNLFGV